MGKALKKSDQFESLKGTLLYSIGLNENGLQVDAHNTSSNLHPDTEKPELTKIKCRF